MRNESPTKTRATARSDDRRETKQQIEQYEPAHRIDRARTVGPALRLNGPADAREHGETRMPEDEHHYHAQRGH